MAQKDEFGLVKIKWVVMDSCWAEKKMKRCGPKESVGPRRKEMERLILMQYLAEDFLEKTVWTEELSWAFWTRISID